MNGVTKDFLDSFTDNFLDYASTLLDDPLLDINVTDEDGMTALMHACSIGNYTFVHKIINHPHLDINKQAKNGCTALIEACDATDNENEVDVLKELLKHNNININLQDNVGNTALMHACHPNKIKLFKILLKRPDININSISLKYGSVLIKTCSMGYCGLALLLLKRNDIDVNIYDINGKTALMALSDRINRLNVKILEKILTKPELNVYFKDNVGNTALDLAKNKNRQKLVEVLESFID